MPIGFVVRICAAEGCCNELTGKRSVALFCSSRCRGRNHYAKRRAPICSRECAYCGALFQPTNKAHRYCQSRCSLRARRGSSLPVEWSPYWREYLRRFDAALLDRTPENWRAFRELSPPSNKRGRPYHGALALLIQSLEE